MSRTFILKYIKKEPLSEFINFEELCYSIDVLLINIFKCAEVYILAILLGNFINTFIMHISYVLLRWSAGGWHANSSINCSIFGISFFSLLPFIFNIIKLQLNFGILSSIMITSIFLVCRYAPSDTEKNPMISINQRKKSHFYATMTVLSISSISIFFSLNTMLYIALGQLIEAIIITPGPLSIK